MLKPAQLYADQLRAMFSEVMYEPKYMYYFTDGYSDEYTPAKTTWNKHEFASVDKDGNVIGYIAYNVDRRSDHAYGLECINFTNNTIVFGRDMAQAIDDIFMKYNFRKLVFAVYSGNPIEKNYDKMCLGYGGRVVGYFEEETRLLDGEYHDKKMYEIKRKNYVQNRRMK